MSRKEEEPQLADKAPKASPGDAAHSLIRAAVSATPVVGGPAAVIFEAILRPPIEKRRDEWIESIVAELKKLEADFDEVKMENLREHEGFITTLASASQIAMRTHQDEKLEALRNAVLNTAMRSEPDEDLQAIFLHLVDRFTPWHLKILKLFEQPEQWLKQHDIDYSHYYMGSPAQVLEDAFPELRDQREFYDLIVSELSSAGLMGIGSLHSSMTATGMLSGRTTQLGRRFLRFISETESKKQP